MPGSKHHPYDRAMRDLWRHATADFVEVLLGRSVPAGTVAEQTQLESAELVIDGLVTDASGRKLHAEFQTRADHAIGWRMAQYHTALHSTPAAPPPDQWLVLLHTDADTPDLGSYDNGRLSLTYQVVRLWEIDPERLLSRPWLERLAALAHASSLTARAELFERAIRAIKTRLPADQAIASTERAVDLASLYLVPDVITDVLRRNDMPIDLSHTTIAIQARDEGRREGLREGIEGQRDLIRRVLARRFADPALAERASDIPEALLPDAVELAATGTAADFNAWLDDLHR